MLHWRNFQQQQQVYKEMTREFQFSHLSSMNYSTSKRKMGFKSFLSSVGTYVFAAMFGWELKTTFVANIEPKTIVQTVPNTKPDQVHDPSVAIIICIISAIMILMVLIFGVVKISSLRKGVTKDIIRKIEEA